MKFFTDDFIMKVLNFPVLVQNHLKSRAVQSEFKIEPDEEDENENKKNTKHNTTKDNTMYGKRPNKKIVKKQTGRTSSTINNSSVIYDTTNNINTITDNINTITHNIDHSSHHSSCFDSSPSFDSGSSCDF